MSDLSSHLDKSQDIERRIYGFFIVIAVGFVLLAASAYTLQVIVGHTYLALSESNRIRTVEIPPARGLIYDRNGVLLVNNAPSFNLYAVPGDLRDLDYAASRLATLIDLPPEEIHRRLKGKREDAYLQVKIKNNLSMTEVARVEAHRLELPGVHIEVEFKRNVIDETLAAHLLGYVGEVSQKQLASKRYPGLKQGDVIGQYGIEQTYDADIRGVPGRKMIEVDALGQEKHLIKKQAPLVGNDTYLTIDAIVQKAAEAALGEEAGAVVALDPRSGEVIALASRPAFNPNALSVGLTSAAWRALAKDERRPMMNRAIQGRYPPGSTYKVIMSAALLETGKTSRSESVRCPGFFPFGGRDFRDWKKGGHGTVALHRALVESCDVYFYKMGVRLPIDTISHYSHLFGLGEATGIPLSGESSGLIPSTEWKKRVRKEPWYPGETLSVSIGQGYVLTTPLQMATAISAVAADGVWRPPRLLKKQRNRQSGQTTEMTPEPGRRLPLSPENLREIQSALAGVVAEPGGTAASARSKLISIAGKTGTAQVLEIKGDVRKKLPKAFDDHAWFVAYAPVEHPQIAVAVLVEHGGHGGSAAAPIAKKVIETYFNPAAS